VKDNPVRILMPTSEFPPQAGGVATVAYEQARGLAARGNEVFVEAIHAAATVAEPLFPGAVVRRSQVRAGAVARIGPLMRLTWAAAREHRPHFIWTPTYRGFGLPVPFVAAALGIPYGIFVHGTEVHTETRSAARRRVMRGVLSRAAFIATNSHNTRRLLLGHFPSLRTPIVPIHPGVHVDRFRDPSAAADGRRLRDEWLGRLPDAAAISGSGREPVLILSAARMARLKGEDFVLRALAENLRRDTRFPAVYAAVGEGPDLAEFRDLATRLGISGRVLFPGPVPYQSIPAAYLAADIYAQPSQPVGDFLESFGISFVEAQAAGLPCIGSDWGGVGEAVKAGETALLVPVGDQPAVTEAVRELVLDQGRRAAMASAARDHAGGYSWGTHAERLDAEIALHIR
jgi:phosphatidylinositol alpha-1,6-mannosyltransferase